VFVAVLLLILLSLTGRAKAGTTVFRIGYQKAANTLVLLKAHGTLEKRLQPLGDAVTWLEFTAGPIDDEVLSDQQRIADAFYDLKLIPRKVAVREAVLLINR